MELKYGAVVHQQCKAPYILGCLLPHPIIRTSRMLSTSMEAQISFAPGYASMDLHIKVEDDFHTHVTLSPARHRDFLKTLSEASTLYLLTGHDHPELALAQRVRNGGVAIEVNEAIRTLCLSLANRNHFVKKHSSRLA